MKPSMKGERGGTMSLSAFKIKNLRICQKRQKQLTVLFFFFFNITIRSQK